MRPDVTIGLPTDGAVAAAALLAALAVWWALPRRAKLAPVAPGRARGWVAAGSVVGAAVLVLGMPLRWWVAATVAAGAGVVVGALLRRRRRRAARARTAEAVLEACDVLAAELSSGQPVGRALSRGADVCAPLGHAAEAAQLGSDVAGAMRSSSATPGATDLRVLAAAWQVAHRSGQGLTVAVERVATRLRAERRTQRVVAAELASARSTARLVAALPVAAWAMGSGAGAQPLSFLLGGPVGVACLVVGAALLMAGLWWIEVLADSVQR